MVAARNHELRSWQFGRDPVKRLDHQFQALVGSPFPESQNTVDRSTPPGKLRKFRATRENAMRPKMNIIVPVLIVQDFSIAWHEYRD
ncbi:MAG TPA: hypothetical protein VFE61_18880 [Candidatus Sulfotelmatobacter sp.]|nr:hypothetical protein [Candidatus Sulfotelmatobacter sp.]